MRKLLANRKGFTLIEMLIVIAVIGILASAVLVGLGPVQRSSRDARRISDLRQVQNALELYFSRCGFYPGLADCAAGTVSGWTGTGGLTNALTGGTNPITRQLPNDPRVGQNYFFGTNGTNYVLGATLEDVANPALAAQGEPEGTIYSVNCNDPVYCVEF